MPGIHLDHNATTDLDPRVAEAMRPYLADFAGNASSQHRLGRGARRALDQAREQTAAALGAFPDEIVFTSGATESNNWAILGVDSTPPFAVYVNPTEHPSALAPAQALGERGARVSLLTVDSTGKVADLPPITYDRGLLVVQLANSETGTVHPVADLVAGLPAGWTSHCDAVQGVGKRRVDFHALGATTLSVSGHKVNGPQGIGALAIRRGQKLRPFLLGGHQQGGQRAGTECIANIVGLGKALELASAELESRIRHLSHLRDALERDVLATVVGSQLNATAADRLPNTTNLSFPGAKAEAIVIALDLAGVYASAGVACSSGSIEPSPTLLAMGFPIDRVTSAVRFSVGVSTRPEEIPQAVARIASAVRQVTQMGIR